MIVVIDLNKWVLTKVNEEEKQHFNITNFMYLFIKPPNLQSNTSPIKSTKVLLCFWGNILRNTFFVFSMELMYVVESKTYVAGPVTYEDNNRKRKDNAHATC